MIMCVLASFSKIILNKKIPGILQVLLNNFCVCMHSFSVKCNHEFFQVIFMILL